MRGEREIEGRGKKEEVLWFLPAAKTFIKNSSPLYFRFFQIVHTEFICLWYNTQ